MGIDVAYHSVIAHTLQSFESPTNHLLSRHRNLLKGLTFAECTIDPAAKIQLGQRLDLLDRALAASYRPDAGPTPEKRQTHH